MPYDSNLCIFGAEAKICVNNNIVYNECHFKFLSIISSKCYFENYNNSIYFIIAMLTGFINIPFVITIDWIIKNFINIKYCSRNLIQNNLFKSKTSDFNNELLPMSSTLEEDIFKALNELTAIKESFLKDKFTGKMIYLFNNLIF